MGGFDRLADEKRNSKKINVSNKNIEKSSINTNKEIEEFEEETIPMKPDNKFVYSITARKGDGKTTFAYNEKYFPGTVLVLSFDRKSLRPAKLYEYPERIKVFDAIKFLSYEKDNFIESNEKTFRYLKWLIEHKFKELEPDWIVFDETETMTQIAEMVMRGRNKLNPFQGTANRNVWKERKLLLKELHVPALKLAKKGIIYTMYLEKDEIIDEGTLMTKSDIPKWTGIIMTETDIVIKVLRKVDKKTGVGFFAEVLTSKDNDIMKDGSIIDITIKNKKN